MDSYHFTIVIRDARTDMIGLEDRLFTAGCDDALVYTCNQKVYPEFDREADTAEGALHSALDNIRAAGFSDPVIHETGAHPMTQTAARA